MIGAALLLAALAPQPPATFEAAAEAVLLDVFVTRSGVPVTDLAARDFEVWEHSRICDVELVAADDVPLTALLVFDTSQSMAGRKVAQLQQASYSFVSGLDPHDGVILIGFSHALRLLFPLGTDREAFRRALGGVAAQGRTSAYDAIFSGLVLARRLPGRPVVLVFSDGTDTASWLGPASVLRAVREADTLVYAVGPGARSLRELAEITGGRVIAADADDLQATFGRVLSELRTRYLLRVTPRSASPGWHELVVRVRGKGLEVRARPGFWRPARRRDGR